MSPPDPTSSPDAATRRPRLPLALSALGVGLLALGVALFASAPEPQRVEAAGREAAALEVTALTIESVPVDRRVRLAGVIEPRRRVEIFSETSGRVTEIGARELDTVTAEQVLVRVDPMLAEVAVARSTAALTRADSKLDLAKRELSRWKNLEKRNAASGSQRDDAVNTHRIAAANQREARANLLEARDQMAHKTILAPFGGVLQVFPVEVGEYLQPGAQVAELLDLETARIVVGVSDREVVALEQGREVAMSVEARPGEVFAGSIRRLGAAASASNRKFPVEIEVPNAERRLLPGMIARVDLSLGDDTPMALIPQDAAVDTYGLRFVYVLEPTDVPERFTARARRVELRSVPFRPTELEVVSGVDVGERIATSSVRELRDGAAVRVAGPAS